MVKLLDLLRISRTTFRPWVDVPRLVVECATRPSRFVLGSIYARVDGFGEAIRTIALYGADLADADLFVNLLPHLVPHRATLKDSAKGIDVLNVGVDGEVGFRFRGMEALSDLDRALKHLSDNGWIHWDRGER